MADYHRLLRVARGEEPAGLVIRNGQLLNVLTRDVYPATVGICEDTIAFVLQADDDRWEAQEVIDAAGKWLAPGLIDSHMHIESTHVTPEHMAESLVPRGVTTIVQDPHEVANVLGVEGVRYMARAGRNLPLRILTLIPTCVPAVPGLETAGATFTTEEVGSLLDDTETIGLAEVMDYWGVVELDERITRIVKQGRERGVILTGHVRFEDARNLNAYLAAGIESDHGYVTAERILARTRLGMIVEVCCAEHRDNVAEMVQLWRERGQLDNVVLVTDDVPPNALMAEGHLDRGVRRAISLGMAPVDAVRTASLVPARRLRRGDLGAIAPGRIADILVVNDIEAFEVGVTVCSGKVVARDGSTIAPLSSTRRPPASARASVHLPHVTPADFAVTGRGDTVRARVIEGRGEELQERVLEADDGQVSWEEMPDLALAAVWHRHGQNENRSSVLLADTGLEEGALATTYAHDSHNLVVVGRDPAAMAVAANALIESGGGYVAASRGSVRALVGLPIAGLLAEKSVPKLAREFEGFVSAAAALGVDDDPIGLLTSLALPVVPRFRLTDVGLVDVARQKVLPAFQFC